MCNRYYKTLLVLASLWWSLVSFSAQAQHLDVTEWPHAQVVLASGDTISGALAYFRNEEIIRVVLPDSTMQAFTPVGVRSFTVARERHGARQVFRSYFWNRGNDYADYQVPAFFEVLQEGRFTLVRREVLTFRTQQLNPVYAGYGRYYDPYGYGGYPGSLSQAILVDMLFLYTPRKKIVALRNPRRDLDELFGDKAGVMKKYIKEHHLSYNETADIMHIIRYFNNQ